MKFVDMASRPVGRLGNSIRRFSNNSTRDLAKVGKQAKRTSSLMNELGKVAGGISALDLARRSIGSAMSSEAEFERLAINANMTTEEIQEVKRLIYKLAQRSDIRIDPTFLREAFAKVIEKTGDKAYGISQLENMALAIQATGSSGYDIGATVADLQKFNIATKEEILEALNILDAQGKMGSLTAEELAAAAEKLFSSAVAAGATGIQGIKETGALAQTARMVVGSGDEAVTYLNRIPSDFIQNADLFRKEGIEVFDKDGKLRNQVELLKEVIVKLDGSIPRLSELFSDTSLQVVKKMAGDYKSEKYEGFSNFDRFLNVQISGDEIAKNSARMAATGSARMLNMQTSMGRLLEFGGKYALIPTIEGLLDLPKDAVMKPYNFAKDVASAPGNIYQAVQDLVTALSQKEPNEAHVTVEFKNSPAGTQVSQMNASKGLELNIDNGPVMVTP